MSVDPSIVILLSSYRQISLPSFRWPASDAASPVTPSWWQPSPMITYTWLSNRGKPGLLKVAARCFSAIAMPTAVGMPWPKGPVDTSTPAVMWFSGCPGVLEFSCRNAFKSSKLKSYPHKCNNEYLQQQKRNEFEKKRKDEKKREKVWVHTKERLHDHW